MNDPAANPHRSDDSIPERIDALADRFDQWRLLKFGGMGAVFSARRRDDSLRVAIKTLRLDRGDLANRRQRFDREIQIARRLDHPNIARTIEVIESDNDAWLVMELVQGRDLRAQIQADGMATVAQAIDWITQAASGLAYAHRAGLIHRDIKPSNLMLGDDGVVRIVDFGVARADGWDSHDFATLTMTGQAVGTPEFMAPEQMQDSRNLDCRADLYSLGCTLHYLLTGAAPFRGSSVVETMILHVESPPPRLRPRTDLFTGRALSSVHRRLLAKDPVQRFASADELIESLEPINSGAVRRAMWRRIGKLVAGCLVLLVIGASWHHRRYLKEQLTVPSIEDSSARTIAARRVRLPPPPTLPLPEQPINWRVAHTMPGLFPVPPRLSDGTSWQLVRTPPANNAISLSWSPDGRQIWIGENFGPIRAYDAGSGQLNSIRAAYSLSLHGKQSIRAGRDRIATLHVDRTAKLWRNDWQPVATVTLKDDSQPQLCKWTEDQSRVAIAGGRLVEIFDASGRRIASTEINGKIADVEWSPDGKTLFLAHKGVVQWDWENQQSVSLSQFQGDNVQSVAVSPGGEMLAVGLGNGGVVMAYLNGSEPMITCSESHHSSVTFVQWSPDGQFLASAGKDSHVKMWYPDGSRRLSIPVRRYPYSIAWHPNSTKLLVGTHHEHLVVDVSGVSTHLAGKQGARPTWTNRAVRGIDWHPHGDRLTIAVQDGTTRTFRIDGRIMETLLALPSGWIDADWTHDGSALLMSGNYYVAVRHDDGNVEFLPARSSFVNKPAIDCHPTEQWYAIAASSHVRIDPLGQGESRILPCDGASLTGVKWSPDGRRLLAWGGAETGISPLRLWNTTTWEELTVSLEWVNASDASWSADSKRFVATNWAQPAKVFDADGKIERTMGCIGPRCDWLQSDVNQIIAGEFRGLNLVHWDGDDTEQEQYVVPARFFDSVVESHPHRPWVAFGNDGGELLVWDVENRRTIFTALITGSESAVTFDPWGQPIDGDVSWLAEQVTVVLQPKSGELKLAEAGDFFRQLPERMSQPESNVSSLSKVPGQTQGDTDE